MKNTNLNIDQSYQELELLCTSVRDYIYEGSYDECLEQICRAMERHPDAPHPHNLLGILLEKKGQHSAAMKHFRAALALDPTYMPVKQNLVTYGTFRSYGTCAYDESDVSLTFNGM